MSKSKLLTVKQLSAQISELLAKQDPVVRATVLADLTAQWVAAHVDKKGKKQTKQLRAQLLLQFTVAVKMLLASDHIDIR